MWGRKMRKDLKDADVDAAVELSIAASEAMVIHGLVEKESALKSLPVAAIVQVALRVKQARLLEKVSDSMNEENDEDNSLSDIDDLTMSNAFQDVGLSFINHDKQVLSGPDISQVKRTPASEIRDDSGSASGEARIDLNNIYARIQSHDVFMQDEQLERDSLFESTKYEGGKNVSDTFHLGSPSTYISSHVDNMLHRSGENDSFALTVEKKAGFAVLETASCKQAGSFSNNISQPVDYAGEYREERVMANRFQSHWIGALSVEDIDATTELKVRSTRNIANLFVCETSFLSESADVAPDENSIVQECGISAQTASQLNMDDQANEVTNFSQEIVISSYLSAADPLCSFVPCSISMENDGPPQLHTQNGMEIDRRKLDDPASKFGLPRFTKRSCQEFEFDNQDADVPTESKKDFPIPVRRQLSSLKTYSMLSSSCDAKLENGCVSSSLKLLACNRGTGILNPEIDCTASHDWRSFITSKSSTSKDETAAKSNNEGNATIINNSAGKMTAAQLGKKAENLQVHFSRKRTCMSNNRKWRPCLVPYHVAGKCVQKNDLKQVMPPPGAIKQQGKSFCEKQCDHNELIYHHVQGRKRVRFSEADVHLQVNVANTVQLQGSLHQNGSTTGSSNRLRYYNSLLDYQIQGLKCLTSSVNEKKPLIFYGMEFLLTGFSSRKEKEIEKLIQKCGGEVLPDIHPTKLRGNRISNFPPKRRPIIISSKKLKTTKFLYGCAVSAFILKFTWITDSIRAGSLIPPEKYMIVFNQSDEMIISSRNMLPHCNGGFIFGQVGVMLHGKRSFYTKFSKVIKLGGGEAYTTLERLVKSLDYGKVSTGTIVTEYESSPCRHLRQCALERKIPIMTVSWIIESLYSGKLLSILEEKSNLR